MQCLMAAVVAAAAAVLPACGDVYEGTGVITCDAEYCIDCVDSCCYDLGYC